jgi:hypothetical protein
MGEVEKMLQRIAELESQVRGLQEAVGKWKRKAQGASRNFEYVAERHERGMHYISVPVTDAPSDLTLHEIQEHVRDHVLPKFYPYRYWNVYTSKRYGGWITTLVMNDDTVDMSELP